MARCAVFYLSRAINHPRFSLAFLKSIVTHSAGADFDLVYFLKGFSENATDLNLVNFRQVSAQNVLEMRVADDLFPTQIFLEAAQRMDYERILFLISYSRILAADWLAIYLDAFERVPSCGIVGSSGGYERIDSAQPFPNINIRTNAFMVESKVLAACQRGDLSSKFGGNLFEAGPHSLTRQIMTRGLAPVVVDRNRRNWLIDEWPRSRTFRSGNQEGLLIADNRTYEYESAGLKRRNKLALVNWGNVSMVARPTPLGRMRCMINWRWPGKLNSADRSR